jgi:hypothetical protein
MLGLVIARRVRRGRSRRSVGIRGARRLRWRLRRVGCRVIANICVGLRVVSGMGGLRRSLVILRIIRLRRVDIVGVGGLLDGATGSRIRAIASQFGRRVRRLESLLVGIGCTVGRGIVLGLLTMRLASIRAIIRHGASFEQLEYASSVHRFCDCCTGFVCDQH